jgi:predicted metalloprotease with PDZ domain
VAHPEYDDKYWRFIEGIYAKSKNGKANVVRIDSSLWKVYNSGSDVIIYYQLRLPAHEGQRAAWRPYLSSSGGLIGGVHSFMYVPGATLAPSHVELILPPGWNIVTGLEPTSDPFTFYAPSAAVLADAPILTGKLKQWTFEADKIPHVVLLICRFLVQRLSTQLRWSPPSKN